MFARAVSNQCLRTTSTVERVLAIRPHWLPVAIRTALGLNVCTSPKNARTPIAGTRFVRVTHPFHPPAGHQLPCVGERYNRYGRTLLLKGSDGAVYAAGPPSTDVVAPNPHLPLAGTHARLRG